MQIVKTDLLNVIAQVLPGVEKGNPTLEGTDTLIISKGMVHTFNNSVSVSAPLEAENAFPVAFKAQAFLKLIKSFTGDVVTIGETTEGYTVACDDVEAILPRIDTTAQAYVDTIQGLPLEWKPLPEDFQGAMVLCHMSVNRDDLTRGIIVDENAMLSTDRHRTNFYEFQSDIPAFRLDAPHVADLVRLNGFEFIAISDAWVHFKLTNGAMVSVKRMDHSGFPFGPARMRGALKALEAGEVLFEGVLPTGLASAVNIANVFGTAQNTNSGMMALVSLEFKKDKIVVKGESSIGKVRKNVKMDVPLAEDPKLAPIMVQGQFLLEASKKAMAFKLYSTAGQPPIMVFSSESYTHMAVTVQV